MTPVGRPSRRNSFPQELEDPEDCTIGEGQGDLFEPGDATIGLAAADVIVAAGSAAPDASTSAVQSAAVPPPAEVGTLGPGAAAATAATASSKSLLLSPPSLVVASASSSSFDVSRIPREMRNLLAGGLAGMAAKSVVAPVDRIKILYQVSSAEFHFHKIPAVVRNIVATEGTSALWKGNTATMIRVFPYSGIQFMVFDRCKRFFLNEHEIRGHYYFESYNYNSQKKKNAKPTNLAAEHNTNKHGLTALESLVAGMIAGTISVVCTYPLDLTRAQLAVLKKHRHDKNTKGFLEVLRTNYVERGVARGLFRGISPTLIGILPYSGIAFTLNEQGKRKIHNYYKRDLTTMERMQCGAFAGLIAQTATYPIEVTRRRMQTLGLVDSNDTALGSALGEKPPTHPGTLTSTIRHLYREQGIRGFFKGVSMNWMKGPLAFSISFTAFDTVQGLLETQAERAQRLPQRFNQTA